MSKKDQDIKEKEEVKDQETSTEQGAEETSENKGATEKKEEKTPEMEIAEWKDKYLRLYSEFENFRRRTAKERLELISTASGDVIKEILPVLDDLDRATESNKNAEDIEAVKEGFNIVQNKISKTLSGKGLKEMEAKGESFDAELHEAIAKIPAPEEGLKGKVIDVIEKGYYLNDKIIRYAKVVVGE